MTADTLHRNVLPPRQQRLLASLGPAAHDLGFYLAGGTALALRLGHRRSIDFDWMREKDFDAQRLRGELTRAGLRIEHVQQDRSTLHGTMDGVRVSFLGYPYELLEPTEAWPAFGCRLASKRDVATMKLAALVQRGARKDFVDLFALLRDGSTLSILLDDFHDKFGFDNTAVILSALSYFDDAEREPMPEMLWTETWPIVRESVERAVASFVRDA